MVNYAFQTMRTQNHVDRMARLRAKGWQNLNASERDEWYNNAALGAYNYTDLNRVETDVAGLAEVLGLTLQTKTNWNLWDVPTPSDMNRYLSNVRAIRDACPQVTNYPDLPETMDNLTYVGANSIEETLRLVWLEVVIK